MNTTPTMRIGRCTLRAATNADAKAATALIDSVYREYGDRLMLEGADPDLLDIEAKYFQAGGSFIVVEDEERRIVATHAVLPAPGSSGLCSFKRLYLHPTHRGGEMGNVLMNWAIVEARRLGLKRVEFWSDSRFKRAHQFFGRFGYRRDGRERHMDDGAMPYSEYFFCLDLPDATLAPTTLRV
ncbi:GNAT family N-acetyltransferase [Ramlibacter rhizophilus]|uniref:GNAT family N-acetyltransferase n=1 Tax=Ramlibacter rhizophilus TaxID=1781167 RepID=A0A4Z0BYQ7_9BURK|nr:GNAT family N-acetyltransferase [Ramlibacter rhizophilus]TFZ03430.1 GNAT family N-acetyltransferase [Ramlibacter rhizophilus]